MRFNIIFLFAFLLINPLFSKDDNKQYNRPPKIKLPIKTKAAFHKKSEFYFYRSVLTGQKWGLDKEFRRKLSHLNLLHLMTPSGLHLSSLFLIFYLLRRKYPKVSNFIELVLCLGFYFFLPGYYSFRRVALIRSFFILNRMRETNYSKLQIFIFFLITDFFFGTYRYSPLSFYLSTLFLALIFSIKEFRLYKMYLLFFVAQLFIAHKFTGIIYPATIVLSPLLTSIFTLIYPILFLNLFFIDYFNYAQWFISAYTGLIEISYDLAQALGFIHVNFLILIGVIIYSQRTKKHALALVTIGLIANFPRDSLAILLSEIGIGL
ncbi:ComEC/Rec2 family competence protein [Halobacteriovorax sp. DA5]|uniref:ComEC/Rec2 family competence protein n=1 Tax=Halobacteriovorax sp. DA5 TaxID=2067553 RepID=UPI001E5612EC|nr:ComEC/Rec2 family competence protein [Halobacteriovorax sp. DA5]